MELVLGVDLARRPPHRIFPSLLGESIRRHAKHRVEVIIKHNMKLRADMTGPQMANQRNERRVLGRESNKLPKTTSPLPLRNLLAILQLGVEHIDRAPPNMSAPQVQMIGLRLG